MFTIVMAVFLYGCVAFQFHPRTPLGVQCPTATVQVTKAPIYCCGVLVGYEDRAPEPGETGFVQCQCAEKQSAEHLAQTGPPKLQVFWTPTVQVEPRPFLVPREPIRGRLPSDTSALQPPPVPPPDPA
jgi:hypothetical protein